MKARLRLYLLCLSTGLLGACASVQLISRYDERTDAGATQLQRDIASFAQALSDAQTDQERWFKTNQPFYKKAAIDIDGLQLRAGAIYKNRITVDQLQLVEDNLAYLALLHKGCVTGPLTQNQKDAVRAQGIDSSLDCRTDYGASIDVKDRGKSMLNSVIVPVIKQQLDSQLLAVITLENAKKRGEEIKR